MKNLITNLAAFALLCVFASPLFAQSGVGKLSGKVTDADTREPLIGANVIIVNTDLGAATNVDGEYFILNIPPGTYDVRFSYVGYAPRTVQEVRIVAGITYELNVEMSTDFTLPEIVVQDRKFFEEKSTNTVKVFDSEEIGRLPVKGVEKLASLQAGVVISEGSGGASGNATINVRGGRGGEVLYIVDGVPQNDIYTGANYSQVSNSAIEQISFQIGGYEAKYGQAQSGIVNVTTKSGDPTYALFGDVMSSSFTDDYGYNLYTANLSGPIIPGNNSHTIFLSGERGWFADQDPRAIPVSFNSNVKFSSDIKPHTSSGIWRYTARTNHNLGKVQVRLGANINERDFRGYVHTYAKNNAEHNPRINRTNSSFSGKISHNLSNNSFWNLNLGYRQYKNTQGDGYWFDNLYAYGDSALNAERGVFLPSQGGRMATDNIGIFFSRGRVNDLYTKTENIAMTADLDFTAQVDNHLLELGGGFNYNTLRFYNLFTVSGLAASNLAALPEAERFRRLQPTTFGYDITGKAKTSAGHEFEPKNPTVAYAFLQDRFELSDIVLNIGLRADYFDTQADILRDPELPYAFGDPNVYDAEDFVTKKPEFHLSPRIGIGFPITATTVFHAQYGKFIQQPSLDQLYTTTFDLNFLITDNNWSLNTGHVESEITTQYEVGFRQVLGDVAALNITAFYKNTQGLINTTTIFYERQRGGEQLRYITPQNSDFGTIKGLALSLDVARVSYFSTSVDYTYSLAEGTGSSTSSSFTAAFRNTNGEIPKVIAPLDFDQRHTGVINVDFFIPKGDLGFFELTSATILASFNSGRPYTPLQSQNLTIGATNFGDTKGYVNSAYGPGSFRLDLKVEKSINFGNFFITPYLWVENVFDAENAVDVYRTTGDPYTTAWLESEEGKRISGGQNNPEYFREDYKSLERTPFNFGIPRLIRLGLKVNFTNITL